MPNTPSSTPSEPDYKAMLDELLRVIHRDGGQYTVIAGYEASVAEAELQISTERRMLRDHQRRALVSR